MEYVPRTSPKPELQLDSPGVEYNLRQAARWVLGVQAVVKFVPRPLTPGPELRQVESVLRARLKCPWTVRILATTYHFLRLRAVGELWPIFAEDDTGMAFERVKARRVHPTIGLGVESVPRPRRRDLRVGSTPRTVAPQFWLARRLSGRYVGITSIQRN